ncbi:MAG: HDOD domain-containing protein, partial [Deltaproteobacteria bacterium]|nr:HDOD domain-containing protein [Deltaproteobacteria bacterium]
DEVGMTALAELVAKDPGMTSKILGVANSSSYHRSGRKFGLEQSLMTLGADMIKTIVISESVFQVFNSFSHSNSTDLRSFWKHSLSAAVMAREIAEKIGYPHTEEAYLAGLLITRWNLDSFLSDSVLYHHEPAARLETAHPLIRIVLLAHLMSNHGEDDPAVKAAGTLCGIHASDLSSIFIGASSLVKQSADYLGIDLDGVDDLIEQPSSISQPFPQDPVHQQLTEEVRNLVLTAEAGRTFSRQQGEAGLIEAIARSARLLFDFDDVAILLMDGTGQKLVGIPLGDHKQRLKEFAIALISGGLVVESALQRRLAYFGSKGNPLGVAEEQLLRVLGSESLVCLPLATSKRCQGILIGGIASCHITALRLRERFLSSFGEQAAASLEAAFGDRSEVSRRAASVADEFKQAARKAVHEANNPLSIIKNYLGVLDAKLERQQPVQGELSILNEEIDRVARIIKDFPDLKPSTREGSTEVNRVVRDVVRLFRDTEYVPASVKISGQPQDHPTEIEVHADTLKQILINLVKNAIEAMPTGGDIKILNNGQVNRDGRLYTELCVMDSGPGIPAEVLDMIFTPLMSTKGGDHQGLGLN